MKRFSLKMFALSAAFAVSWAIHAHASLIIPVNTVVTPGNMGGWSFFSLDGPSYTGPQVGSIGQMVSGPATPPLGVGSAEMSTTVGGGDGGVGLTTGIYNGILLSDITSLSYSAYCTANNGSQFPYLVLNVNLNDGSGGQDSLFFEPPYQRPSSGNPSLPDQGATALNTWQVWNASEGGWWDYTGVGTPGAVGVGHVGVQSLSTFLATYPDATIAANTAYPMIDGVTFQVGFGSSGDTFTGYVDNVTIGTSSGTTTYDFEPVPEPTTMVLLVGALWLPFFRRMFRKNRAV